MRIQAVAVVRCLVLSLIVAATAASLLPMSADAESVPTLSAVRAVGSESAMLSGTVDTGAAGDGDACYSFEYDVVADWVGRQDSVTFTNPDCLATGQGVVPVDATIGCFPAARCTSANLPLISAARYEAVLFVQYQGNGGSEPAEQLRSGQVGFTTKPRGSILVTSTRIGVRRRLAAVHLKCASTQACRGKLVVISHQQSRSVTCLSSALSMKAGAAATIAAKLSTRCAGLISSSGRGGVTSELLLTVITDQRAPVSTPVALIGLG